VLHRKNARQEEERVSDRSYMHHERPAT
jgi:hypothetical protein